MARYLRVVVPVLLLLIAGISAWGLAPVVRELRQGKQETTAGPNVTSKLKQNAEPLKPAPTQAPVPTMQTAISQPTAISQQPTTEPATMQQTTLLQPAPRPPSPRTTPLAVPAPAVQNAQKRPAPSPSPSSIDRTMTIPVEVELTGEDFLEEDEPMKKGDLITNGPGVELPQVSAMPKPTYPPSLASGRYAKVVLGVLVDENGAVIDASVKSASVDDGSAGTEFRQAALAAARQARFEPATKNGIVGQMWGELTYEFGIKR